MFTFNFHQEQEETVIWVQPWLLEVFPDNGNLAILASHWLSKFHGVDTGEIRLSPSTSQLDNGQHVWVWGSVERLSKELDLGWSPQQTQEIIDALLAAGLFKRGPIPSSVTLDENVLRRLREKHRHIMRQEARRRKLRKRASRQDPMTRVVEQAAREMGLTEETARQGIEEMLASKLFRLDPRTGDLAPTGKMLRMLEERYGQPD